MNIINNYIIFIGKNAFLQSVRKKILYLQNVQKIEFHKKKFIFISQEKVHVYFKFQS